MDTDTHEDTHNGQKMHTGKDTHGYIRKSVKQNTRGDTHGKIHTDTYRSDASSNSGLPISQTFDGFRQNLQGWTLSIFMDSARFVRVDP